MSTRRGILIFVLLLLAAIIFWKRSLIRHLFSGAGRKSEPRTPSAPIQPGKSRVGVAGGGTVHGMIREAVSLIGGFGQFDLKGKTVLVKPNVVYDKPFPATTNPELVGAVVRVLYEEGAKKVFVGDMSAAMYLNTLGNMEKNGIKKAAEDAGAEVIAFEDHGWVEVDIPKAPFKKALVTEWLYRVDFFLNLPVIKTHRSATYSICLKNFIGCTHIRQRPYLVDSSRWEEVVAEMNLAYRPDLNIVDGTVSMIEGGPWHGGTPAKTSLIIASTDRVAADVVGLGVIKAFGKWEKVTRKEIWEQKQIRRALDLGIGRGKEEIVLLESEGGSEFKELMKKVREATGL
jgi:uncharacterized protein (DUF362 family)